MNCLGQVVTLLSHASPPPPHSALLPDAADGRRALVAFPSGAYSLRVAELTTPPVTIRLQDLAVAQLDLDNQVIDACDLRDAGDAETFATVYRNGDFSGLLFCFYCMLIKTTCT